MSNKTRLDVLLVERGLQETRQKAQATIMAGIVYVNNQKVDKPGTAVLNDAAIEVRGKTLKYVSRGGLKLEKAMKERNIFKRFGNWFRGAKAWKKAIVIFIAAVLIIAIAGFAYVVAKLGLLNSSQNTELTLKPVDGYINILALGVDNRDMKQSIEGSRTDMIMIVSLEVETGEVTLTSIYRDTYVKMESYTRSSTPYQVEYRYNADLVGADDVTIQTAYTGYFVETYRCHYAADGTLISRTYEDKSDYDSRDAIIETGDYDKIQRLYQASLNS